MKRVFGSLTAWSVILVLEAGIAPAQTPGQVPIFDQPGTGACNNANGNDCIDSVITQDASGNIGIGTTAPVAKLHIANGNLNLESSSATSGNILKGGSTFIHDTGPANTFMGQNAGNFSVTGDDNIGIGINALASIADGFSNTAVGGQALQSDTSGHTNTAIGRAALPSNTTGYENTAVGRSAMFNNMFGSMNTAIGVDALHSNFDGTRNVAVGERALFSASQGIGNVAIGTDALKNVFGSGNIALGDTSGINLQTGSTNILIGYPGASSFSESNTTRIGNCYGGSSGCNHQRFFAAGISNSTVSGVQVFVNSSGQLGVLSSSRRFKEDIRDMGDASAILSKLRPVAFYYKPEVLGGPRQLQYGLIAEEVAAVDPDLVEYSASGEPFTVRYQLLTPMLLNEMQREDRQLDEQQKQIADLQAQLSALSQRLFGAGAAPQR